MSIKSFLINGVENHYDYNELENIPEINGVLLKGKLTTEELGIKDGKEGPQGEPGAAGADGYSPTVAITEITGGHRVTVTDKNGAHNFDVMDGEDGEGSSITVDSALSDSSTNPVQNKVVKKALDGKGTYTKPSGGIPASDLASGVIPSVPAASSTTPLMDGNGSAGSAATYARADHVHPSDTSRLAANQGTANAGKFMVVGSDGIVAPVTMQTWQGGNY